VPDTKLGNDPQLLDKVRRGELGRRRQCPRSAPCFLSSMFLIWC
jgi:hypothetical protein